MIRPALAPFVAWIVSLPVAAHEVPTEQEILGKLRRDHPRIYADSGTFDELKERIAGDLALYAWLGELETNARFMLAEPPLERTIPDGRRLLYVSRLVLERVTTMGLVYKLEGDRRYLDRIWAELESAAGFSDWNPSHFLDTAEMTHAFGIAYDWLYHDWTDAERQVIRDAIIRHGLEPGMKCYLKQAPYGWWTERVHNWNQVCNGGLTVGALAIADEKPEPAGSIVRHALESVPRAMGEFAPDGAYKEGPSYWGYGTSYNVFMIAALESALGTDFGLSQHPGFSATALFPLHMTGPTGYVFNFADADFRRPGRAYTMAWLADRFDLSEAARFAPRFVEPAAFDLLWSRPAERDAPSPPVAKYWRGLEAMTIRGSWDDPRATWVAFKAGSPSINHAQADLGSFVLDALGKRWAFDLGRDDYNLPGYFDRAGKRWHYFRNRAEGHNTLVVHPADGPDQVVDAETKMIRFSEDPARPFGVMDLTDAYRGAARVRRGIALLDRRDAIVQDEIELNAPAGVYWSMHTPAKIALGADGRRATLTQGDQALVAVLVSPDSATFTVRPSEPLPGSPNPDGQADNRHVRALTIHLPEVGTATVVVLLRPIESPEDRRRPLRAVRSLDTW